MLRTHSQHTSAARSSTGRHRGTAGASMAEARWDKWTTGDPEDLGPHPHTTQSADDPDHLVSCFGRLPCAWEKASIAEHNNSGQLGCCSNKRLGSGEYSECELYNGGWYRATFNHIVEGGLRRESPDRLSANIESCSGFTVAERHYRLQDHALAYRVMKQ